MTFDQEDNIHRVMDRVTLIGVQTARSTIGLATCFVSNKNHTWKKNTADSTERTRHYVGPNEPTENVASAQPFILRWQSAHSPAEQELSEVNTLI